MEMMNKSPTLSEPEEPNKSLLECVLNKEDNETPIDMKEVCIVKSLIISLNSANNSPEEISVQYNLEEATSDIKQGTSEGSNLKSKSATVSRDVPVQTFDSVSFSDYAIHDKSMRKKNLEKITRAYQEVPNTRTLFKAKHKYFEERYEEYLKRKPKPQPMSRKSQPLDYDWFDQTKRNLGKRLKMPYPTERFSVPLSYERRRIYRKTKHSQQLQRESRSSSAEPQPQNVNRKRHILDLVEIPKKKNRGISLKKKNSSNNSIDDDGPRSEEDEDDSSDSAYLDSDYDGFYQV